MEDLKKIQEFFSKPLEEGKQLDKTDFSKVVKAVEQTGHPVTVLLVPKFNEIEILTGMDAPDDMIRDLSNAIDSLGYGRNDIIIAADSSNLSRREYSDIFRVNGGHKDYFEESVNEMDMNDPVLMKMRAAKDKLAKMRAANAGDDGNDKFFDNAKKIAFLKKERAQLMRDMEQEAEPEGGPIADEYGSKLNRIDAAIAKLSGRKEMTYDQAINEYDVYMPSQEEVDKFFALTQNETHYLNSKPVMGQEGTFNLMPIEPWDEYDLSNWNSLVRKAKQRGKSIDEGNDKIKDLEQLFDFHTQMDNKGQASIIKDKIEKLRKLSNSGEIDGDEFLDKFNPLQKQLKSLDEAKVDYDFSERELIRVLRQLKRGASTEVDMIKAFTKALGRDLTKDELFSEAIAEELSPKDFPVNFTYGGTTYVFNKIAKDRAVYYNPTMDGDIAVFGSREEMDSFLNDYTSPRGGTQSSQFEAIAENDSYARVSKPRFVKDKNNPNFLNVYIDYDLGPGGSSIALGKETMTGQIRRLSAAKAKIIAYDVARDLKAKYDLEDIDIQDLENGKVRIFAVSDDFIDMDPNMLSEATKDEETTFHKKLDTLVHDTFGKRKGELEEVVSKVISKIKEDRPGLWANIHAKKERGEKPSHGNSKAHKDSVKAGKRINKIK